MSKNRYSDLSIIDKKFMQTYNLPVKSFGYKEFDLTKEIETRDYVFVQGDRIDHLAARFLGDDQYWWVIALINKINYPFASGGLTPGVTLKIPVNVTEVLQRLMR